MILHMMRGDADVKDITRVLSALTNPTRLRLVCLLLREELCVCELVDALRIPQYKVSRHLARLRSIGLVEAQRNGRWMYYSIGRQPGMTGLDHDLLKAIDAHMQRTSEGKKDYARLAGRLAHRVAGRCVVGKTCR
jgi:ArsR family transcriptional regulator